MATDDTDADNDNDTGVDSCQDTVLTEQPHEILGDWDDESTHSEYEGDVPGDSETTADDNLSRAELLKYLFGLIAALCTQRLQDGKPTSTTLI